MTPGWTTSDGVLAGHGAAQSAPGLPFSVAAHLGAIVSDGPAGWTVAGLSLDALSLPSYILIVGPLPSWHPHRGSQAYVPVHRGTNAAVVGLPLAALHDPAWKSSVHPVADLVLALAALALWRAPPWLVVVAGAEASAAMHAAGIRG